MIDSGTSQTGAGPGVGIAEVVFPERPGSALDRADRIDGALSPALAVGKEKDAVSVVFAFDQAVAALGPPDVLLARLGFCYPQMCGNCGDVRGAEPDISCVGAGAAVAAPGALERKPCCVPGRLAVKKAHDAFKYSTMAAGNVTPRAWFLCPPSLRTALLRRRAGRAPGTSGVKRELACAAILYNKYLFLLCAGGHMRTMA